MHPHCPTHEHLTRRSLLKGTLATATGGTVLNLGSLFSSRAVAEEAAKQGKRCILLWMNGGASQFETFDMKVGQETGGPFRPIQTKLPGVEICELLPRIAGMLDELCVVRSMRTSQIDHPGGIHLMHTGYAEAANVRFPELGAVLGKYLGRPDLDLPSFVKISSNGDSGAGFLGPKYAPFNLDQDGNLPPFSKSNLDAQRETRRHELRSFVEETYARSHPAETARMHREAYDAARRLQKTLAVFDAEEEWTKSKDLYGDSLFGKRCLIARRLVEAGVPFVEVGQSEYDTHADNFSGHKGLVPACDHAWSGLITDLKQRGLFDDTLVIWMGEIGRTPRINNRSGRDHYVRAWSTALAGAGVKRGYVHGSTDEEGYDVVDGQVTEADFFGTIYKALGLDPHIQHYVGIRPIPITPFGGEVCTDLLA
jgi:hypothetical protein